MIDENVRRRIEDLITDYAHCIDDDRLEEWPGFFTDDCRYMITSRDNHERHLPAGFMTCNSKGMLEDRVLALRSANIYEPHVYRHLISAIRIFDPVDGFYPVETGYAIVRTMQEGDISLFSSGKYVDKVVIENGAAKFKERVVVCDSQRVDTLIVIPI